MDSDFIPEHHYDGRVVYTDRGPCMKGVVFITSGPNNLEWWYSDGSYFSPWTGQMAYPKRRASNGGNTSA